MINSSSLGRASAVIAAVMLSALPLQAAMAQPRSSVPVASSEGRTCVRDRIANTRIMRTFCKTAQEWETAGGLPGQR